MADHCVHELPAAVAASTENVEDQASPHSIMEGKGSN